MGAAGVEAVGFAVVVRLDHQEAVLGVGETHELTGAQANLSGGGGQGTPGWGRDGVKRQDLDHVGR